MGPGTLALAPAGVLLLTVNVQHMGIVKRVHFNLHDAKAR